MHAMHRNSRIAMYRARLYKLPYTESADSYTTFPVTPPLWEYLIFLLKGNYNISRSMQLFLVLSSVSH